MENQMVWQDEYSIGVEVIDREHQRLFKIINRLLAYDDDKRQWACQEGIKYFKTHAMKHFTEEEDYMASIGYEGLETHRQIHRIFRDSTLPALERELEETGYSPDSVKHFLGVCAGWLIGHTLTEDQAIVGGKVSKWGSLLPEEELDELKKVIVQQVFDMFRLESEAITTAYGGEKFGQGVYYRLVYDAGDDLRQEIIMVFEEKLLINTVGRIMGLETGKLDVMLVNAARYTARQFVKRVLEHFPSPRPYVLKEENLISYEQFQGTFERAKPQVSLLFNTSGSGYFAYCVIAPHLLEKGTVTPIQADNALEEIADYLARRERDAGRPKVLVVDDSSTVRVAMRSLLEKDYEVSVAESGVAAIRAISLDRPDLVLLDYEMPVCDGRQTLEMLRSEKAFADIPVIFLTGRSDPDVVRALLALKPAGYLLKYLKPADIKQKIDELYQKLCG